MVSLNAVAGRVEIGSQIQGQCERQLLHTVGCLRVISFKVVIVLTEIVVEKITFYILIGYQVVSFIKENQDMYYFFSFYSPSSK